MLDLIEVNQKVYDFLIERRREDKELRFTLRKSNFASRLEEGYWFYGNDTYLAVSFWTGMDWKNRTPNIIFVIGQNGDCSLEFNVSDSDLKRNFVENVLFNSLNLDRFGRRYLKRYSNGESDYLYVLSDFLMNDKLRIDEILRRKDSLWDKTLLGDNLIEFIDPNEFTKLNNKVKKYQTAQKKFDEEYFSIKKEDKPSKIQSFKVADYGLIKELEFHVSSKRNQWVLFSGENGTGKTNILRAIGTVLGHRLLSPKEMRENQSFSAEAVLIYRDKTEKHERHNNDIAKGKKRPVTQGLAMYGPYRLDSTDERIARVKFLKELLKEGTFKSIMTPGAKLLSLDKQIEIWKKGKNASRELLEKRIYFIKTIMTMVVPGLVEIKISLGTNIMKTEYVIQDTESFNRQTLSWDRLPSGQKNVLSMVGDILIRLYDQQRDIVDPSQLTGVVLIDEIDLHLHPKAQKEIVENLTKIFPNIQFIATTHSPIPLLGLPVNSQIYRVKNSLARGVYIERVDDKIYLDELLPNSILTSPVFNMDDIFPASYRGHKQIRTEDSYSDIELNRLLDEKINRFLSDEKENDLILRIKKRRNS